jgi:hypothetical protein
MMALTGRDEPLTKGQQEPLVGKVKSDCGPDYLTATYDHMRYDAHTHRWVAIAKK